MDIQIFWDKIKTLIKEKGITQQILSEKMGYKPRTLENKILRNQIPDIIEIEKFADFLDTAVEYLITGKEKITYTDYEQLTLEEKRLVDDCMACSAEHKKSVSEISEICESFAEK